MSKRELHTPDKESFLRQALRYDPETGVFIHALPGGRKKPGKIAGTISHNHGNSYRTLWIGNVTYRASRLAWFFTYDEWPQGQIDHINGDGLDNRIANLRLATNSQNMANRRHNRNSTSPYKGVSYVKKWGRWVARIQKDKKRVEIGYFFTPEEAHAAYVAAAREAFGEFARAA
jgi:hypothetical protein